MLFTVRHAKHKWLGSTDEEAAGGQIRLSEPFVFRIAYLLLMLANTLLQSYLL